MKVAIFCDTHFGVRNDNAALARKQVKANKFFMEEIRKRGIKTILHAGDLFDKQKYVNFSTLSLARESFLEELDDFETHIIAGNHDQYYVKSNKVNALTEVVRGYTNISVHTNPTDVSIGGNDILLLPWICQDNHDASFDLIANSKSKMALAHLELVGFEQYRGLVAKKGLSPSIFNGFNWVGTGHYHQKSSQGNIHYLGAAYQFTWADFKNWRGITILDLEDQSMEMIENPYKNFYVYHYNDSEEKAEILQKHLKSDFGMFEDCYVRVIIEARNSNALYDTLMQKIHDARPIKVMPMENVGPLSALREQNVEITETPDIIRGYVKGLNLDKGSEKLTEFLIDIHDEAMNLEKV